MTRWLESASRIIESTHEAEESALDAVRKFPVTTTAGAVVGEFAFEGFMWGALNEPVQQRLSRPAAREVRYFDERVAVLD